jgi:hypothetical protein
MGRLKLGGGSGNRFRSADVGLEEGKGGSLPASYSAVCPVARELTTTRKNCREKRRAHPKRHVRVLQTPQLYRQKTAVRLAIMQRYRNAPV